uniref:Uncharacterized protein n=1 Tax=Arundo donax TaxID=35708 RepID=A0A0A9B315_ARUDO
MLGRTEQGRRFRTEIQAPARS